MAWRLTALNQLQEASLPNLDLKDLLDSLDSTCRDFLEKASRLCVRQRHTEVSVDHYLLQMLDGRKNQLNLLLEHFGVDPVDWIKRLLVRCEELEHSKAGKPVFSGELLDWFESASIDAAGQPRKQTIQVRDLVIALLRNQSFFRSRGLDELDRLSEADVESFFVGPIEPDVTVYITGDDAVDPDRTLLMSADEIANTVKTATACNHTDGLQINGYGDLQKIGEGGMASVYRAVHLGLDRDVALKVLKPGSDDDDFAARFLREARIVAKLAHPNIIQIYDVNQLDGITYLAMEYVSGGELSDKMDNGFSLEEAVKILSQVLAALQFAHDKGYIHRDIKPANILFREDGSIALTDFGIARLMGEDSGLTIAGSILGTPRYMSPEQARGDALDHRSDLYSVGVLFYHMIEGKLPYIGDSAMGTAMKHILDPIPKLSPQWSALQSFIDRAMAKDAGERFQSGLEMIASLELLNE
jgi:predicted Ser/Thr protein kinase